MTRLMPTLLLVLALVLAALAAAPAHAREVEATGQAAVLNGNVSSARQQALLNAQRNAVEQGVGLLLDSQTVMQNFEVLRDKVLTSSQGFVTDYLVTNEGLLGDQQTYEVTIRANVSEELLTDRLEALRILHKAMGNQRVMVVYQSDNPNALDRDHGANRAALGGIRDELNGAGFRLFNQAATDRVYDTIEQAARVDRPDEDLIAIALDQQADILVKYENIAGQRDASGGAFAAAYATIRMSVFDTVTGRQIADAMVEGKQLLRANAGPYDWEKGLASAAEKAARQATQEAITKITDYYKQIGDEGFNYLLVFRGFDDAQEDVILDFLENTPGFKDLSELKNTVEYMEVELFSDQEPSRLRRLIRAGLDEKGLTLQTQSMSRNRIVFSNANAQ